MNTKKRLIVSSNMTPSLFFLILRKLYFTFHLIIGERKAINGKYIGKQECFLIKGDDVEMTYLGNFAMYQYHLELRELMLYKMSSETTT